MSISPNSRAGFVAIFGAPNVGKSTLLNKFVGTKVSIVSPKVQTTRSKILGIHILNNTQIIFIDTPGIFLPKSRLDRAMVSAAWNGVREADQKLLLVDASKGYDNNTKKIVTSLSQSNQKATLAINKIDLVAKHNLLKLTKEIDSSKSFSDIFMISAKLGDGTDELLTHLTLKIPEGPWLYPENQISDMAERLTASEITREKLYLQ